MARYCANVWVDIDDETVHPDDLKDYLARACVLDIDNESNGTFCDGGIGIDIDWDSLRPG